MQAAAASRVNSGGREGSAPWSTFTSKISTLNIKPHLNPSLNLDLKPNFHAWGYVDHSSALDEISLTAMQAVAPTWMLRIKHPEVRMLYWGRNASRPSLGGVAALQAFLSTLGKPSAL